MIKPKQKRRDPNAGRRPAVAYKKQPIYSYTSSRKESQRHFNRGENDEGKGSAYSRFMLSSTKIAVGIIVFIGLIYFQSLSSNAKVKLTGDEALRSSESYEKIINEELQTSKLNLSKLSFNTDKFSENLMMKIPEAERIKVSLPLFQHQPKVEVYLADPIAQLVTSEKTYYVDSSGKALFTESEVSGSINRTNLLVINDTSGHSITIGKPALTSNQIDFIKELKAQTAAKNINIENMTLSNSGAGLNVKFKDISYIVKFSFLADHRQSSGAFIAINDQISASGTKVSEYVDLRIPDRAYIK